MTITGRITAISPAPAENGVSAPAMVAGLGEFAAWITGHLTAPMPSPHLNIDVRPGDPAERLAALEEIARRYEVEVTAQGGFLVAERRFGAVAVGAHLSLRHAGPRHARQIARAGNGAAA